MTTKNAAFSTHRAITGGILSLVIGLAACGDAHSSAPPPTPPPETPVRVVTVERAQLPSSIRAVGRLGRERSWSLGFKNGGTLRALLVQEGQWVKAGQRLALVDQTEITAQVAQARSAVEKTERDLSRVEKLHASQAAAQNDADNARTAAEVARASLSAAIYNQGAAVLVAPQEGRIDKRLAEVGEQLAPGRPVFSMSGSQSGGRSDAGLVMRAGVVDRELVGLRLGDHARISVDALPGRTFNAQVSRIATVPSPTSGTYELELQLLAGDTHLCSGMTAKVDIDRDPGEPLPVVPLTALIDAEGESAALYTLAPAPQGTTVRRTPVHIARVVGDRVAIDRGLTVGDKVVSEGAGFIEPGRRVRAVEAVVAKAEVGHADR